MIVEKKNYTRLHQSVKKLPNIGTLRSNHILGISAIVGIIPFTMYTWVVGGAEKAMNLLVKKFINLPDREQMLENIRYLAEIVTKNMIHCVRGGENIACKLGRCVKK